VKSYSSLPVPEGTCKKAGEALLTRAWSERTRGNGFKLKEGRFRLDIRKVLYCKGGEEALAQVAQRSCRCRIPGSVQGLVGWGFERPVLVEDVPAHGRGAGTRRSIRSVPTQTVLWLYDSVNEKLFGNVKPLK